MAQSQQLIVTVPARHPGDKIYFEISPTTPLHKLFGAYSARQDVPLGPLCWSFAGKVVGGDQTPADIGLEDGGQLDAWPAALTRSPPPGGLPQELLPKLLEFLPVDDVNCAKGASFCWREMGRFAIAHGRWKPVKFVAEHGNQLMFDAAHAAQIRLARTPAEHAAVRDGYSLVDISSSPPRSSDVPPLSLARIQKAWAVDGLRQVPDDLMEHHIKFAEKVRQLEEFLQLEQLMGSRAFARRTTWRTYSSFEEGYLNLVECAARSPGQFLTRRA